MTKVRFAVLLLALLMLSGCTPEEPETPPEPADLAVWVRRPNRGHSEYYSHNGTEAGALLAALEGSLTPAEGETMTLNAAWYQIVENRPVADPGSENPQYLVGLWCDGLFLAADGTLYRSDMDMGALLEPFSVTLREDHGPFCNELCHLLGSWQAPLLDNEPPVQGIPLPQGRIIAQTDTGCTVRLEAPADRGLQYPYTYAWLEVQLDGVWHRVPEVFAPKLYACPSMYPSLAPGEHLDVHLTTEPTARYGTLLPGQYRWNCFLCEWPFTVE